jgi:ceramide glucosyltransferase
MVLTFTLATLAFVSLALTLWQWAVAWRFPLHQRVTGLPLTRPSGTLSPLRAKPRGTIIESGESEGVAPFTPSVTLLKPLKGCDAETEECLRSWLMQDYAGPVQILFGTASADDPVCAVAKELIAAYPECDVQLVLCGDSLGPNAKVSTLIQLDRLARHDVVIISDADVRVPTDLLSNVVAPLREAKAGLVNCFYRLANPSTLAMRWEAICVNSDFWSQVLQSRSLKPLDFALGAVMAVKREALVQAGGLSALAHYLADDYQLGHFIAARGWRIELCPVVVECWEPPMNWRQVWRHQLRWARTIRVCQPIPYFFSILSNATLWPALLLLMGRRAFVWWPSVPDEMLANAHYVVLAGVDVTWIAVVAGLLLRVIVALSLQTRLTQSSLRLADFWMVPLKDLLGAVIWALAFVGNTVEWRGARYQVRPGGKLEKI